MRSSETCGTLYWFLCGTCDGMAYPKTVMGNSIMFECAFCKKSQLRRANRPHRGSVNGIRCTQVSGEIENV